MISNPAPENLADYQYRPVEPPVEFNDSAMRIRLLTDRSAFIAAGVNSAATLEASGNSIDRNYGERHASRAMDRLMRDLDNPGIPHAEAVSPEEAEELPERWDFQS